MNIILITEDHLVYGHPEGEAERRRDEQKEREKEQAAK